MIEAHRTQKWRRRMPAAVATIMLCLGAGLFAAPAEASTNIISAYRCGPATIINVRGTNETAGTGTSNGGRTYQFGGAGQTLQTLRGIYRADQNIPVYEEALNYPAAVWGVAPYLPFIASVHQGAVTLRAEIEDLAASCPTTNILLAGYSQGAQVIGDVLDYQSSPQLSANAKSHVVSIVLFGDSSYRPDPAIMAPGDGTNGGLFVRNVGAFRDWNTRIAYSPTGGTYTVSKIRSYCWPGDQFCQAAGPSGSAIHASYGAPATAQAGWTFLSEPLYDFG